MKKLIGLLAVAGSLFAATEDKAKVMERLDNATAAFHEILAAPDKGIPADLISKAQCAVIVPGLKKAGFIVGVKYGKGFMTCRNAANNGWSAPAAIEIEGGSYGLQIGGEETDVVMLVMGHEGAEKLMADKFTLGGEASAAAGPVGRTTTAQTDAQLSSKILSWSRSHGIFAGISLDGATLKADKDDNYAMYGKLIGTRDVIYGNIAPTPDGRKLTRELDEYSRHQQ